MRQLLVWLELGGLVLLTYGLAPRLQTAPAKKIRRRKWKPKPRTPAPPAAAVVQFKRVG